MALQVWLPLTKDLRNQGLSDVTVTNNGATFNSAGKLGGCYQFGTGDSYITIDSTPLKAFTEFSFACWVKIISWNTSYSTVFAAKNSTSASWNNLIFSLLRTSSNSTLCFNISNGSSSTTSNCQTGTLSLNTWYHITCTYKSGEIKLYQDGNVVSTYNTSIVPNFNSIVNLWIGKSNANSYQSNNLMNDVRIYDHCLSPMEVRQLSQGLVLHYPLNRQGFGQDNLLSNSNVLVNNTSYGMHDYYFTDGNNPIEGDTYTISLKGTLNPNRTMFLIYNSGGSVQECTMSHAMKNEQGIFSETFTWRTGTVSNTFLRVYAYPSSAGGASEIEWVKLEKGSIATPWSPAPSDTLADTMGLNSNIEYDTSGYCNNGTRTGIFSWTSDTPKYSVSQVFNGTDNAIQTPSLPTMITDKNYTIAVWIYKTAIGSKNYQTIYGGPSGFELEARNGTTTEAKFVGWNWGKPAAAYEFNEWNHCVFVHSDDDCKVYLNGEYVATGTAKASNPSGNYFIGAWKTAIQQNFEGLMSDFRIYATALSADDVKSLYQNCATIDADGTIHGQIRS